MWGELLVIQQSKLLAALAVILLATAVADLSAAEINWSGWYVYGAGGWGWRAYNAYPPTSYYVGLGANFAGGGYGGSSGRGTARYDGPTAAAGVGYNYQFGKVVIGAEYEFLYADLQTDPTHARTSFTKGTGIFAPAYIVRNYDTVNGDSNRWYGIARLRAGVPVMDRGLFYLAAGPAYRLSYKTEDPVVTTIPYFSPAKTTTLAGYNKSHAWGVAFGAGFDYAVSGDWWLRSEWMHLDFGDDTYIDPVATALIGKPTLRSFKRSADIVRAGLEYRFYGGEHRAGY
jgi:outer membrane immunogenic protein